MTEIICSRWGKKTNFSDVENTDLKRIIRVKPLPKKYLVKRDWIAIATDGTSVRYKDTSYPINNFFSEEMFPYSIRILVLTEKERQLLLRNVTELEYLKNIDVFEYLYPIFTDIRYSKNIIKSHKNLISYLRRAKRFSPEGIPLAKYVSFQNHKKLLKKVAFKNGYDKYFALTDRTAYQEVFTLTEERPNRTVIALDYNAMFPDCLSGEFADPKKLYYRKIEANWEPRIRLQQGIYQVILKKAKSKFFSNYHYLTYSLLGKRFRFKLDAKHSIKVVLYKNEIEEFVNYFEEIYILDGIVSDTSIYHPLFNEAQSLYAQKARVSSPGNFNALLKNYFKFSLVTLHGTSSPKSSSTHMFESLADVEEFLFDEFGFDTHGEQFYDVERALNESSGFEISSSNERIKLTAPNHNSSIAVHSLTGQVLANARLKILKSLKMFSEFPTAQICYVNVDSIHLSIDSSMLNDFLLKYRDVISNRKGEFKVQTIGDQGYWLDIGRYWIGKSGKLVQHKNIAFNSHFSDDPFRKHRYLTKLVNNGLFSFIKGTPIRLENGLSFSKKLESSDRKNLKFTRYNPETISTHEAAAKSIDKEILYSKNTRLSAFKRASQLSYETEHHDSEL